MNRPLEIEDYFSAHGALAEALPLFEPREGQKKMAKAVHHTLEEGPLFDEILGNVARILVAEAETGIGKTMAYLVPAVLSGRKIVVSTATINLQDQILKKDIPLLEKVFGGSVDAVCVKGRQNYLCHYRWNQYRHNPQRRLVVDEHGDKIEHWLSDTETGDRAELEWLPDNSALWYKIASHSAGCLGADCPEHGLCFINRLRKRAAKAKIMVVNHHLLFSDLALRKSGHGEVLPRYEAVIFDEAHHVENVASAFFGRSFSQYQVLDLLSDLQLQAEDDLPADVFASYVAEISGIRSRLESFVSHFPPKRGRFPLRELIARMDGDWQAVINDLSVALNRLGQSTEKNSGYGEVWNHLAGRAYELEALLQQVSLCEQQPEEAFGYVHWYERKEKSVVLSATPIHVADEIEECLYRSVNCCILTSATLSIGGDFSYIKGRLGLSDETEYLQLHSPFDYAGRTKLYVPESSFPEPSSEIFISRAGKRVEEILNISGGRALVLFTSFRGMEAVAEYLETVLQYPVYVQGSLPRKTLLEKFSTETRSVLLAVASFWEGVDVPGESLSCLIIDKLPFEVPSDPVIKARVDEIQRAGGKPFFDFQIPRAVLSLKQGVGRLMRASSDSGLIAILDVRLFSKGYGKSFMDSLPPSPVVRSLEPLHELFEDQLRQ